MTKDLFIQISKAFSSKAMDINTSIIPVITNSSKGCCKHTLPAGSSKLRINIFSGFSLIALSKKLQINGMAQPQTSLYYHLNGDV